MVQNNYTILIIGIKLKIIFVILSILRIWVVSQSKLEISESVIISTSFIELMLIKCTLKIYKNKVMSKIRATVEVKTNYMYLFV